MPRHGSSSRSSNNSSLCGAESCFGVWCAVISWLIVVQTCVVNDVSEFVLPRFEGHITSEKGEVIEGAKIFITWTDSQNNPELDPSIPPNDRILGSATSGRDGSYAIRWNGPTIPGRREHRKRDSTSPSCILLGTIAAKFAARWLRRYSSDDSNAIGVAYQSRVVDGTATGGRGHSSFGGLLCERQVDGLPVEDRRRSSLHGPHRDADRNVGRKRGVSISVSSKSECVLLRVHHPAYESELRFRTTTGRYLKSPICPIVSLDVKRCGTTWRMIFISESRGAERICS